jgi:hypothetical protein
MSRFIRRSISPSQQPPDILAVCFGVFIATLTPNAYGSGCMGNQVFGPAYSDVPFNATLAAFSDVHRQTNVSITIDWGDGTVPTTGSIRTLPCGACGPRDQPNPIPV